VRKSRFRVVIAVGGVAGLETLMALHGLTGDRAELTLVAPQDEFVYGVLGAEEPFEAGPVRRVSLDAAARDAGAEFIAGTVDMVDPTGKALSTLGGDRLPYDALVLAVGAEPSPRSSTRRPGTIAPAPNRSAAYCGTSSRATAGAWRS
jgi:NADH dehydrogenase